MKAHDPQGHAPRNQNENLIFEKSSAGEKRGMEAAAAGCSRGGHGQAAWKIRTQRSGQHARVSEIEIIPAFHSAFDLEHAIDLGMYPLGSCTMKYNPRVNEFVSRVEGAGERATPYQPAKIFAGRDAHHEDAERCLIEITAMDAITLQPAAARMGIHRTVNGSRVSRSKGNARKKILIPDSAHGKRIPRRQHGWVAVENLKSMIAGMVDVRRWPRR